MGDLRHLVVVMIMTIAAAVPPDPVVTRDPDRLRDLHHHPTDLVVVMMEEDPDHRLVTLGDTMITPNRSLHTERCAVVAVDIAILHIPDPSTTSIDTRFTIAICIHSTDPTHTPGILRMLDSMAMMVVENIPTTNRMVTFSLEALHLINGHLLIHHHLPSRITAISMRTEDVQVVRTKDHRQRH